jgi:hypothetical protein
MKKLILISMALALGAMLTLSTQSCKKNNTTANPTLYDTIGGLVTGTTAVGSGSTLVNDPVNPGQKIEAGKLALRGVVDSAIFIIAADTINTFFTVLLTELSSSPPVTSGFTELEGNLTNFFAYGTGAPQSGSSAVLYTGLSMSNAHNPAVNPRISHPVNVNAYASFTNDVVAAAVKNHVPANVIGSLGKIIASLETSIVNQ